MYNINIHEKPEKSVKSYEFRNRRETKSVQFIKRAGDNRGRGESVCDVVDHGAGLDRGAGGAFEYATAERI